MKEQVVAQVGVALGKIVCMFIACHPLGLAMRADSKGWGHHLLVCVCQKSPNLSYNTNHLIIKWTSLRSVLYTDTQQYFNPSLVGGVCTALQLSKCSVFDHRNN